MSDEPGGPSRRLPEVPGRDPEREAEDELRFHLEMRAKEYVAQGMPEEEARAAAARRLGDAEEVRSETAREVRREQRAGARRRWFSDVRQDVGHSARSLLRSPSFSGMAVATLTLAVGATTAIFSVVWAVLLAPMPYPDGGDLVRVWETSPQGDQTNVVSAGNVFDWQRMARSFESLGGHYFGGNATLTGEGDAHLVGTASMEPEAYDALRVEPILGRGITKEDAELERSVAVISEARWRSAYGADPGVLGRTVVLNQQSIEIVGVYPESMTYPAEGIDFWMPIYESNISADSRTSHNFVVLARLADGVTIDDAQREMDEIVTRITAEHPAEMTGWGANVVPLRQDLVGDSASLFKLLLGAVALVLLIACGNLANLILARSVARHRELAVRGALGANRSRILRHLLIESSLIAGAGAAAAALLAPLLLRGLLSVAPSGISGLDGASIDLRMLGFTGAVAIGSVLLFGLLPALRSSRVDLGSALRSSRGSTDRGHLRIRAALLTGQVALSVVLLIGSGLLVRSFRAVLSTDLGLDAAGLTMMDVFLPPDLDETSEQARFFSELTARIGQAPGVAAVATTSQALASGTGMTFSFAIEGRTATNASGREDDEMLHAVSPSYFDALRRPMVQGRTFSDEDGANGVPVVILNESLARKHFPAGDAVGQRIAFRVDETPWREIVGVVADARVAGPDQAPVPAIYIPFEQKVWDWLSWSTVVVRTRPGIDEMSLAPTLRSSLAELGPEIPPRGIRSMAETYRSTTSSRRFAMTLVTGFGVIAILLCVVGLYGLLTYSVARERREIGVRMALGANQSSVVRRIVSRAAVLALAGSAVGVAVALVASPMLDAWLYGISRTDAATYAAIVVLVSAVAIAASLVPALRAGRIDPAGSLRAE